MIIFAHLLNDSSGSPRVLASSISVLAGQDDGAVLYVSSDGRGVLEGTGIAPRHYWYRRSRFRIVTLFTYAASQLFLASSLARARDLGPARTVYVNTLLPFAAALWGRWSGKRVVYHLHEVSVTPGALRRFLVGVAARCADLLIYVSEDHRARLPVPGVKSVVVHNPIDPDIGRRAAAYPGPGTSPGLRVLMLASPRTYKGIPEFLDLAQSFGTRADMRFTLVLNGTEREVEAYLSPLRVPANVTVHARTSEPAQFFEDADLLVNLSRVDQWIETFGLTLIEAMAFGLPVIAPPAGGPVEIVTEGQDGWLIDSRDPQALAAALNRLADDVDLRERMSLAARERASDFSFERYGHRLRAAVSSQDAPSDGVATKAGGRTC